MEFKIEKRKNENIYKYPTDDVKLVNDFAQKLKAELGAFLIAVVMFVSTVKKPTRQGSDIHVLVIGDDISFQLTQELIDAYRIITEHVIGSVSRILHVTSMTVTSFW